MNSNGNMETDTLAPKLNIRHSALYSEGIRGGGDLMVSGKTEEHLKLLHMQEFNMFNRMNPTLE